MSQKGPYVAYEYSSVVPSNRPCGAQVRRNARRVWTVSTPFRCSSRATTAVEWTSSRPPSSTPGPCLARG
eukprot:127642-Chlamydomonas_euryale.AAC.1